MDVIRFSINKPVGVLVGVILLLLFGVIGLLSMPYQLSPSVTEPEIAITTTWVGATPYEIERDIIEEQEKVLKGIPGLVEMESSSLNGEGTVTLRFRIGTVVEDALLRVSNKLDEVPSYPQNVDKPIINATGAATSPVIWMILKPTEDKTRSIYTYRTFFENEVRQYLERVKGVADLFVVGGTEKEMQVVVSPEKLAAHGLTIEEIIRVLNEENTNVSAGIMGVGRRDYRIRTVAEFDSPEEIERTVIRSTGEERVTIGDVARAGFGYARLADAMIHNGDPGIAIGVKPEPGENILELTDRVQVAVDELNEGILAGENIFLDWVYDQRPYIRGAIDLVKQNILIGGFLAIAVLLLFLRSVSSTVVVAVAIPISVIGTFLFMNMLGRNLNVVSLAGISFAVGMLVDNAIVVLENIDRHRRMGKTPFESAYDGAKEVWGAVLASTLTTVAVFLPVALMEEEAGQLFRDIAIAVTGAVALSLFVSVSVIPMLSQQLFRLAGNKKVPRGRIIAGIGSKAAGGIMTVVRAALSTRLSRIATVVILTGFAVAATWLLFPKMEYLPQGNRNLVIGILIPPPGMSYDTRTETGQSIFGMVEPYMGKEHEGLPGIKNLFYVGSERINLFGAVGTHEQRAGELVPLFTRIINSLPGMFGVSNQSGIFETRLGRGRTIEVNISGNDLGRILQVAGPMFGMIAGEIPGSQVRPIPSLELLYPEVRLLPSRERVRAAGMDAEQVGVALDVLMDGREIDDFKQEGQKKIDLVVKAAEEEISTPEELYDSLLAVPGGRIVPVSSLTDLVRTTGVAEIRHLERKRAVTLQVTPPETVPLQSAMETIQESILPSMARQGMLEEVQVEMSGTADKLTETRKALQWNFVLVAVITYLLMSALFGNFLYPLVIMFTVPLAAAGGFIGLRFASLIGRNQPLDILTMLGFVILIGVVVNNAILIVHQSLNNIREGGMGHKEAVLEATRTRLRPIYMSASTSIFGMLPLVVMPGPGSELYRGLGSVVLGGLAVSTVFTIFVIPSLLLFFLPMERSSRDDG